MSFALSLTPGLDLDAFAQTYAARGIVQIPALLTPESAEYLLALLAGGPGAPPLNWRALYTDDNDNPVHYSREELNARGDAQYKADIANVVRRARDNRGFFYQTYPMIEAYMRGWDQGHPIHRVTEFINSPGFLDLGKRVTGVGGVTKADAHATAYGPGHFLTRHVDEGADRERRAAYVLGLTKDWQPDWGGLLLFLNERQDVMEGFLPRFNVLTIFDIKYLHTVTQVSSFAGAVRYSVTGWFRDDPAAGV